MSIFKKYQDMYCNLLSFETQSKILWDLKAECNTKIRIFNLQLVIVLKTKFD